MSYEQLKDYISLIPYEKKEELKENFYKEKIEEAIYKKTNGNIFIWKDLPEEVVELIMGYKFAWDIVWVPHILKHNDFTIKSMERWLFTEYDFKICPTLDRENWAYLWTLIINEKDFEDKYFDGYSISDDFKSYYKIKMCDKHTLSLTDFIEYRQEQKKEQKLRIQKKKQQKIDSLQKFNVGDILVSEHRFQRSEFYSIRDKRTYYKPERFLRIASETKTQYRMEIYTEYIGFDGLLNDRKILSLDDSGKWIKYKNLTKKHIDEHWECWSPDKIKYRPMDDIMKSKNHTEY